MRAAAFALLDPPAPPGLPAASPSHPRPGADPSRRSSRPPPADPRADDLAGLVAATDTSRVAAQRAWQAALRAALQLGLAPAWEVEAATWATLEWAGLAWQRALQLRFGELASLRAQARSQALGQGLDARELD